MASGVKGYKKAIKDYDVCAVGAVGMGATGTQVKEVRTKNKIPSSKPVFTLQGGFELGIYKLMMTIMVKTAGKGLANKQDRTQEEDQMLEMMLHGGK